MCVTVCKRERKKELCLKESVPLKIVFVDKFFCVQVRFCGFSTSG